MMQATRSAGASSAPIRRFEKVFAPPGTTVEATSRIQCQVFIFEDYTAFQPQVPAKHTAISQLVGKWEQDGQRRAALEEGRRWVADTFYGEDGDTVRTLRLRKGWSQARLAAELRTSQSHIARIERGTENLTIETCRKLSRALGIDLNTLDQALKRQEAIAQAQRK
ncbi:helix-turn-helix domain-containing protein [Candidatus Thiosymbion oneisti]|uniref:helix-turn-helix domain-containing protein n=1 Tax=Candidatus Thiosymbion oneisti TaxID=589554 RepID=UPI00105BBB74|nr:helix-turn-helix transcriptional regulator [Candidatus Thiosymbion oneisti]